MLKAIPLSEAKKLFPDYQPQWKAQHPGCLDPQDVALGNPRFGTVRQMVIVETDETGTPIKPCWDQWQIEEGPVDRNFPGTIIVPYFWGDDGKDYIVLRKQQRPVRGTNTYEFPQGGVEGSETIAEVAIRELKEETGLSPHDVDVLLEICAEPDWFPRGTQIAAVRVDSEEARSLVQKNNFAIFPLSDLAQFTEFMDAATSLAALMRFMAWFRE